MDPITFLTATSLAVASVGGLTAALVSWQTWLQMREVKKQLHSLHSIALLNVMKEAGVKPSDPDGTAK